MRMPTEYNTPSRAKFPPSEDIKSNEGEGERERKGGERMTLVIEFFYTADLAMSSLVDQKKDNVV